ncbi:hypothetical protein T10_9307 [Trichinella papuae]|uniref:Uncharacterized protein n=1 Tax=Trichinella papuae TaxID=268474 RepID=A0A0V1M160_9BILA|nr:hypothetical protein T10_9307 [Trichinella papuae]
MIIITSNSVPFKDLLVLRKTAKNSFTGNSLFALPMLMHTVAASFVKISREIRNEERCGYVHCTCQIVSDRLIPIFANFGSQSLSRNTCLFCEKWPKRLITDGDLECFV